MKLEHWMQLIFSTVILGALGFIVVNMFDMKGTLSSVSVKVETTDQRLARIANTLPEVKARIAWEEINYPLSGFVMATIPKETTKDKWTSSVMLYDAKNGQLQSFSLTLDKNHKDFLAYVVAGKVRSDNAYDPSFAELALYSSKEKEPVSIPATLNAHTSFVLRNADIGLYSTYLKEITGQEPQVKSLGQLRNWKEVAAQLNKVIR
jgi:hypothetical protein